MIRTLLPALSLAGLVLAGSLFLGSAAPQKRVKPKGEADFPATLRAAGPASSPTPDRRMTALVVFWLLLLAALRGAAAEWPSGRDTRSAAQAIAVELDRPETRVVGSSGPKARGVDCCRRSVSAPVS